ncbi:hypothetical protein [Flexivirga alba]|uniref:Caspase family protein n=1 Tax=Flexivirga alba TaxID=702742 RepID=A0ABW2AIX3_9MICO
MTKSLGADEQPTRTATLIAISDFASSDSVTDSVESEFPYERLTAFMPNVNRLSVELEVFGYTVERPSTDALQANILGNSLTTAIGGSSSEIRIVHILSHGERSSPSGRLLIIGSDGNPSPTSINDIVSQAADNDDGPLVLFILDLCHAGVATELFWQLHGISESTKAWVISATSASDSAFDARLTRAVSLTLSAARDGTLGLDPSERHIPWLMFRNHIITNVEEGASTGLPQRVRSTPWTGLSTCRSSKTRDIRPTPRHAANSEQT